jgi:cation diffusion facilitator CzcD-associated flavoprotein CzcO
MPDTEIIIVGGGAAGLSAAGALRRRGRDPIVLEKLARVGDVWARRYDRLRLHTVYSSLAHYPLPRRSSKYPSKDEYAAYLRSYAAHFKLRIIAGCPVERVHRGDGETWLVESACGEWRSRAVVIAVGQYGVPLMPSWPGRETYRGRLSHSAEYTSGRPYAGQRVLVVGAGNSGAEIATDLAEQGAAFVAISIRTPPPIVARDPFGMPAQRSSLALSLLPPRLADRLARMISHLVLGDLTAYGMPPAAWWPYSASSVPLIDVGFVDALKRGRLHIRPQLERLSETGAIFADGRAEPFDAVIAATGFRTGLEQLIDLPGALDSRGEPAFPSGRATAFPGLYFIGYTHSLRGHLFEANRDSRRLAKAVEAYLG